MDIVSECLSAAMWLAEDVIWTVVTMFHYGFNIICEMIGFFPGIFEALHSVGHWSSYTLSHALLTVAECGCHVLIITGSCLSYAIIAIAQWTIQCMVFCASLFYSCGQFVAALPWVEVFTTFFQSATSTVSLLRQQGQYSMGLAWNIIKYVIVVHAALFIVLVVVISLILYHRRVTTSRAAVIANALHLPRMQTNRQPRRQSEEREEHIDRTDTPMVHDSVHTRPTPTVALGGGGPSTQDGETTSMFRKELEEGEHLRRRVSQLSVELSREKDKSVCVVCLDAKRDVLLNPCKHFCLCRNCINTIRNCPICNRRIHSSERIFNV